MSCSYTYKGLRIYKNKKGSRFNAPYYSVVNPRQYNSNGKMLHCHCVTENSARKVADCFDKLMRYGVAGRYSLNIRNKALMLINEKVVTL
jgi:hypothetical protein